MTGPEIIAKVKELNFPEGSYIVFGSCPMALAGLRESNDIDFLVSPELFTKLADDGWQILEKSTNDKPLVLGEFEAHVNWNFSAYKPTLEHLLKTGQTVDGIPFASLEEVRKWKQSSGRPKDLVDIKLINKHLKNSI